MRLLLDTHVVLWWFGNSPSLGANIRQTIGDSRTRVYVSAVSVWEAEVKRALGKLDSPDNIVEMVMKNGFIELPMLFSHALAGRSLPRHHRDPFDRMLLAQANCENLTLVTADTQMKKYTVPTLNATEYRRLASRSTS